MARDKYWREYLEFIDRNGGDHFNKQGNCIVREYIIAHPEITGGKFEYYSPYLFYGMVNGKEEGAVWSIRDSEECIDTENRIDLISWTFRDEIPNYFDQLFKDPEKVKREYTSEDGHRLIVKYDVVNDPKEQTIDFDCEIEVKKDPADESAQFESLEEFFNAVEEELQYYI